MIFSDISGIAIEAVPRPINNADKRAADHVVCARNDARFLEGFRGMLFVKFKSLGNLLFLPVIL